MGRVVSVLLLLLLVGTGAAVAKAQSAVTPGESRSRKIFASLN